MLEFLRGVCRSVLVLVLAVFLTGCGKEDAKPLVVNGVTVPPAGSSTKKMEIEPWHSALRVSLIIDGVPVEPGKPLEFVERSKIHVTGELTSVDGSAGSEKLNVGFLLRKDEDGSWLQDNEVSTPSRRSLSYGGSGAASCEFRELTAPRARGSGEYHLVVRTIGKDSRLVFDQVVTIRPANDGD